MAIILDKMNNKIQAKLNNLNIPISLWGNGVIDAIGGNHEFDVFEKSFEGIRASHDQPPEIFLIVGPINKTQVYEMKTAMEKLEDKKPFVVYAEGLLPKKILNLAPHAVTDIRNYMTIDLEYHKYPLQIDELVSDMIQLLEGKDD